MVSKTLIYKFTSEKCICDSQMSDNLYIHMRNLLTVSIAPQIIQSYLISILVVCDCPERRTNVIRLYIIIGLNVDS